MLSFLNTRTDNYVLIFWPGVLFCLFSFFKDNQKTITTLADKTALESVLLS